MLEYREQLNDLYYGTSEKSVYFRFGLIAFDFVTISFFIVTSMVELSAWIITIDFIIAFVLSLDFSARLFLANNRLSFLIQPISLLDILVILALLAATIIENLAFLRVFRSLRLLRSYHLLKDLRVSTSFLLEMRGLFKAC
jgi:voltage-gated potassium channel